MTYVRGIRPSTETNFEQKYIPVTETGCWLWTAASDYLGYGQFSVGGRMIKAHRYAWEQQNGPIAPGLIACHKCDTPACVNPDHLFLGTHKANAVDRGRKGRHRRTGGESNSSAKLTLAQVGQILVDSRPRFAIAHAYGVSPQTISDIRTGKRWAKAISQQASP